MAKIVTLGDAAVLTSAVKLEDYKKVKKYRPKALVLMGGDDEKEEVFRVGVVNGAGSLTKFGVEFGKETHDDKKLACLTVQMEDIGDCDIKKFAADKFGPALILLNKIEEKIPDVLKEIADEEAAVLELITVAQ